MLTKREAVVGLASAAWPVVMLLSALWIGGASTGQLVGLAWAWATYAAVATAPFVAVGCVVWWVRR